MREVLPRIDYNLCIRVQRLTLHRSKINRSKGNRLQNQTCFVEQHTLAL